MTDINYDRCEKHGLMRCMACRLPVKTQALPEFVPSLQAGPPVELLDGPEQQSVQQTTPPNPIQEAGFVMTQSAALNPIKEAARRYADAEALLENLSRQIEDHEVAIQGLKQQQVEVKLKRRDAQQELRDLVFKDDPV